ncbi:PLP-dependent transferase [Akkermansiaceae bacterium]|nr:PLP-dependent transferase [Akkermansiaceae bacterium]
MRDLKTDPASVEADLGKPLPDTQHACSVCLPTWDSVIGYEEKREKVIRRLNAGYPRFFLHPLTQRLFNEAEKALADVGSKVVLFTSSDIAQRAQRFVEKRSGSASRIASYEGLQALIVSEVDYPVAMEFWRYTGEIVSSRQAKCVLEHHDVSEFKPKSLRSRIAQFGGYAAEDIFIYENGMAAIFASYRAISKLKPGKKTLQLEFPYVDALKIQNSFGNGVVYLNEAVGESLEEALRRISKGEFSAVYCEAPSNPLLRTIDLKAVSKACREGGVPLVVDDTICSVANIKVDEYADIITTSLTKWISGKGDVMAGQVTVCKSSPLYSDFKEIFNEDCPEGSRMFASDARVLARNISGFKQRINQSNINGERLAEILKDHPAVEKVWYPKFTTPEFYNELKREEGGYGGLISFVLKSRKKSAKFFDALQISKGPSLGMEFSLACPYTMLAHYDELEWAEGCGVDRDLIRISCGTEPEDELVTRLEEALSLI